MHRLTRREILKYGVLAGGSMLLPIGLQNRGYAKSAGSPVTRPFTLNFRIPRVLQPVASDDNSGSNGEQGFEGTDYYVVVQKPGIQEIIPGYKSAVWGYNGTFPGSTIKQRKGRRSVVRHINKLPGGNNVTVHLHGMAALPEYDGYAEDLTSPGYCKDYIYPNDRAATLWYHDHAIAKTAFNVYQGLAAFYIVQDSFEDSLPLPKGDRDVPLMIHDKQFNRRGQVVFDDRGHTEVMGDVITVNGVAWPKMKVAPRRYRFRVLNGSISRSYRLALSNGDPLYVIGTDAGLKTYASPVKDFRIGMAERYEVIIDFSKYKNSSGIQQVVLKNLDLAKNINYDKTNVIMRFDVDPSLDATESPDPDGIEAILGQNSGSKSVIREVKQYTPEEIKDAKRVPWRFERTNSMWVVNGKVWDKDRVDNNPDWKGLEVWEITNTGGGWFHPVHVHLLDQQIITRNGRADLVYDYEKGWKDVFYLGPNERMEIAGRYGPHQGRYMMHCHNTVHEDHDMMTQIEVGKGGNDPINAAPRYKIPVDDSGKEIKPWEYDDSLGVRFPEPCKNLDQYPDYL